MDAIWNHLNIERLLAQPSGDFICPRTEQTVFFVNQAWADQLRNASVTHTLLIKDDLAGFVTLSMDSIPLAKSERPAGVPYPKLPALKIVQMGVRENLTGIGLGKHLVTFALATAIMLREQVGCRYVTLDSKGDLVPWYEKLGFVRNELDNVERQTRLEITSMSPKKKLLRLQRLPVSMRFDLNRSTVQ